MDKIKLLLKNGRQTVVPVVLEGGKPPEFFSFEGRTYRLHHRQIGTGTSDIRAVYGEVVP